MYIHTEYYMYIVKKEWQHHILTEIHTKHCIEQVIAFSVKDMPPNRKQI